MLNVIRVLINPYNQQKSKIQEEGKGKMKVENGKRKARQKKKEGGVGN